MRARHPVSFAGLLAVSAGAFSQSPDSAAASAPAALSAQKAEDTECMSRDETPLARWLACRHIKVRKSFETEQDESKPAAVAFESGQAEKDYYRIDVAIRLRANPLTESLLWYPVIEVHRSTQTTEELNKKSAALKLEYYPFSSSDVSGGGLPVPTRASLKPYFLVDGKATRDAKNGQTVGNANLLVSLRTVGPIRGGPGRPIRCGGNLHCFRWRPYVGIERYDRLAVGSEDARTDFSGNLAVAKLAIEIYPLRAATFRALEIVAGGEYRNRLSSHANVPNKNYLWSAQLNWYLDKAGSIALGVDYEDGRGPENNFASDHRYGLALKFKFTGLE